MIERRWFACGLLVAAALGVACADDAPEPSPSPDAVDGTDDVDLQDAPDSDAPTDGADDGADGDVAVENPSCEEVVFNQDGHATTSFTVRADVRGVLWSLYTHRERPRVARLEGPEDATVPLERLDKLFGHQDVLSADAASVFLTTYDVGASLSGEWLVEWELQSPVSSSDDEPPRCIVGFDQPIGEQPMTEPTLSVRFVLVADPQQFASSPTEDPNLQRMVISAGNALGSLGVTLHAASWEVAPESVRDSYAILESLEEFDGLMRLASVGASARPAREVVVFLIDGFAAGFAGSPGITVGQVGSIPGASTLRPSDAGALAVTLDGVENAASATYFGEVLAHELGHFLGLTHTTEQDGVAHDTFDDTPECGATIRSNYTECPDSTNLMFPIVRPSQAVTASDGQAQVVQRHPFVGSPR